MGSDVGQIFPTASLHRDHSISYTLVCEKEISHLRGQASSVVKFLYHTWTAHDGLFFSHFSNVFCRNIKKCKKRENFNFLLLRFTLFLSSRVLLKRVLQ